MDNKTLALSLANCETEEEVISLLKKEKFWDNERCWQAFGNNNNNWGTIGNQQSDADAALVEKIVNSIDALLMKKCLLSGIDPKSHEAPQSIADGLELFFGIPGGKIQNLTGRERTKLAEDNIILTATGEKTAPNITIVDKGEGQSPERMPHTILSINQSNKSEIPFVQGKFNMGGTGVLCFCGKNNFQLVICKRCPDIPPKGDKTHNLWGVTIVRREPPPNNFTSSRFVYLTDQEGKILSFSADDGIKIVPTSKGKKEVMEYGMFCKLFDYKLPSRQKTNINMGLFFRLSTLLPNLAYPVYMDECRKGFIGTMHRTLSGLNVRLSDQLTKGEESNIEDVDAFSFTIDNQKIDAVVYIFKKKNSDGKKIDLSQYRGAEGVLITQNGQTQGSYDRKFYSRNAVDLSVMADSLLTIVDCTNINLATREELFMNSRDRTRVSVFANKLEKYLEDHLRESNVVRDILQKRREESLSEKLADNKPLEKMLDAVFKSSPVLSKLFNIGERLKNPKNYGKAKEAADYKGKYNPTFFTIYTKNSKEDTVYAKNAELDRKFRIRFATDAENNFFFREKYSGEYCLIRDDGKSEDHAINLHNGIATLNVELPADAKVGDIYRYKFVVTDTSIDRVFENVFEVKVINRQESPGGENGKRTPPRGEKGDGSLITPRGIKFPNIVEVGKEKWEDHNFTKESAMDVKKVEDEYDFFINVDNIHLQTEMKGVLKKDDKVKIFKARYIHSMVMIGLGVLGYYYNRQNDNETNGDESSQDNVDPLEMARQVADILSPIILPLVNHCAQDETIRED